MIRSKKTRNLHGILVIFCKYGLWYREALYLIPEGPYMNLGWDLILLTLVSEDGFTGEKKSRNMSHVLVIKWHV